MHHLQLFKYITEYNFSIRKLGGIPLGWVSDLVRCEVPLVQDSAVMCMADIVHHTSKFW